jgi:hypothetical protein
MVAIARKLLVMVWHLLAKAEADKFADPLQVALGLYAYAHRVHTRNLPDKPGALQFTRDQLDRLGLGEELTSIPWNKKRYHLPPSKLPHKE